MTVVVAALVGFLAGRALWIAMRSSWSRPSLLRENYQGISVPTAAGVILAMALVGIEGLRMVFGALGLGGDPGLTAFRAAALVAVLGFTILGLLDDLTGSAGHRGFRGHLRALVNGELTSGGVKLFGGGAIALLTAALINHGGIGWLLIDAAIIALCANLINLFDTRPGRASKIGVFLAVILLIAANANTLFVPIAIVAGAAAGLLMDDLRERLMLGDTGANALGAAVGLGLVMYAGSTGRIVIFAVLLALNLVSEVVSYSKIINGFAPFRMLDELGRRRPPVVDVRDSSRADAGVSTHVPSGFASNPPRSLDEDVDLTPQPERAESARSGGDDADIPLSRRYAARRDPFAARERASRFERNHDDEFFDE